jgi:DeoR family fructose operon transcriptional repressor
MIPKQRQDQILELLKTEKYVTVKYLTSVLRYSTATANRDLNEMQSQGLLKRCRGGAEAINSSLPPLAVRQFYMQKEKRRNASEAARLIEDGDCVFLDASTTVQQIVPFLLPKKDVTVITNSLYLTAELSKHGISVICLGGRVVESPYLLDGEDTVDHAMKYRVDKMFFSVNSITPSGTVGTSHYLLHRVLLDRSQEAYLLTDRAKLTDSVKVSLCDLSRLTGVISDIDFPEETKRAFPAVRFIRGSDGKI